MLNAIFVYNNSTVLHYSQILRYSLSLFLLTLVDKKLKYVSRKGLEWNFDTRKGAPFARFMSGAKTNVAYNCLERNVERGLGDKA